LDTGGTGIVVEHFEGSIEEEERIQAVESTFVEVDLVLVNKQQVVQCKISRHRCEVQLI